MHQNSSHARPILSMTLAHVPRQQPHAQTHTQSQTHPLLLSGSTDGRVLVWDLEAMMEPLIRADSELVQAIRIRE